MTTQPQEILSPTFNAFESVYMVCARKYCENRILFEQSFISERKAANFAYLSNLSEIIKIGGYNEAWLERILLHKPDFTVTNNMIMELRELINIMKLISREASKKFLQDTQFAHFYVISVPYQKLTVNDSIYATAVNHKFEEMQGTLRNLQDSRPAKKKMCGLI